MEQLCPICHKGRIIQDLDSELLCELCGAVVNEPEKYGLSQEQEYYYHSISNEPLQRPLASGNLRTRIKSRGGKIVRAGIDDPITNSATIRPSYDNINMYDLISDYIRPLFNLNRSTCEEVKRLFRKCERRSEKPFHLSEYVGACVYVAILQSDRNVRYGKRKYKNKYRYRKRNVTSKEVAEKLNATLSTVKINHIKYKDVKPNRIRRCAEELAKEFRLSKSTLSKIPVDPAAERIYNNQVKAVERAMADIIIDKLEWRRRTKTRTKTRTGPFDRVCLAFTKCVNRLDKTNLLRTSNILTNKRHLREPNAIAAAFIYKLFRNKVTIRTIRKAAGCGDKSLQKALKILS